MAKGILKFNLSEFGQQYDLCIPTERKKFVEAALEFEFGEEQADFLLAVKALDLALSLWDVDQHLRSKLKYEELEDDVHDALQEVRDKLWEIMGERGVDLDRLIE